MYIYTYIYMTGSGLLSKGGSGVPLGPSLPTEARHARCEATRFVTAHCPYHKLKTAHNTDQRLHIPETEDCI